MAGIPTLPVKGIVIASTLYDDPIQRPMLDVDVLVRPRDFHAALRIANSQEWPVVRDSRALGGAALVVNKVSVDLACTIGPPGLSALGVAGLLNRASRIEGRLGFPHWSIELHDHALLVAVDLFKDKLVAKPRTAEDFLRIGSDRDFRPAELVCRAKDARLLTALYIVTTWVTQHAPSHAWKEVRRELEMQEISWRYVRLFETLMASRVAERSALAVLARAGSDARWRRCWAVALGAVGTTAFLARHGGLRSDPWHR